MSTEVVSGEQRDRIRAELERILASAAFAGSERHRSFLAFVVDQTLRGDPDKLNEFVLGFEVFGKNVRFDPRIDSIVRVEARRLRERLRKYYDEEGAADPLRISLRPRSFVPLFEEAATASPHRVARLLDWLPSHKSILIAVVALVCGIAGTTFVLTRGGGRARSGEASLLVLPFVVQAAPPEQQMVGDSIADALITGLTGVTGLRVMSRGSAIQFQAAGRAPGADLKVDYVVEGTVRVDARQAVVTARMTDTRSGSYVWAQSRDCPLVELPQLEETLARQIAARIHVPLGSEAGTRMMRRPAASWQAHAAFLKGQYYWYQWDPGGVEKSIGLFEEALRGDPNYAPAWAWLAQSLQLAILRSDGRDAALIERGRQAARKALELDPQLAEAHAAMGAYQALEWNWSGAGASFQRAIELNPNLAQAHLLYATMYLVPTGQLKEAMGATLRAHELDPLTRVTRGMLARMFYYNHEYARAMAELEDLRRPDQAPVPEDVIYYLSMGFSGQSSRAINELRQRIPADRHMLPEYGVLGYLLARNGDRAAAQKILAELLQFKNKSPMPRPSPVVVQMGLGDSDAVFALLDAEVSRHTPMLGQLLADPLFDPIRQDTRYRHLLQRMGIEIRPSL
jgi:TolB-like protein/lipoprotein NlpI